MTPDRYIPALRFAWLSALYDPVIKMTMREDTFRRALISQLGVKPGYQVLDLGCGTGTLSIVMKQSCPDAEVVGMDADRKILDRAASKALRAGLNLSLEQGMAAALPYANNAFDRVVCSLVLHHLTRGNKRRTLEEVFRVLRPGGELHVADFGKPHNATMSLVSLVIRYFEEASDNIQGLLPEMFRHAGFRQVEETAQFMTVFGTLSLWRAIKP